MVQNEGDVDRVVRVVVGAIMILTAYSVLSGTWQIVLYILGGVLIMTSLTGFCLIYKLLGVSTKK